MSYRSHFMSVAVSLLLLAGCASVPEVEEQLRRIGFEPGVYVVQPADTVPSIAFRYRMSPAELAALNPKVNDGLKPGMRLAVRRGTPGAKSAQSTAHARTAATEPGAGTRPAALYTGAYEPRAIPMPTVPRTVLRPEPSPESPPRGGAEPTTVERHVAAVHSPAVQRSWPREQIITEPDDVAPQRSDADLLGERSHPAGSRWWWPTDGQIARSFQPERVGGQGVDIAGAPGQDVRAAMDGRVVYSGRDLSGVGNLIILEHADNLLSTYSHTAKLYVAEDDLVRAGDPIASLGANERQESVLGFEIRRDGNPLNPLDFLPARPVP